eukprot:scaffold4198_cov123-Isochrysis_galbana.AAC.2
MVAAGAAAVGAGAACPASAGASAPAGGAGSPTVAVETATAGLATAGAGAAAGALAAGAATGASVAGASVAEASASEPLAGGAGGVSRGTTTVGGEGSAGVEPRWPAAGVAPAEASAVGASDKGLAAGREWTAGIVPQARTAGVAAGVAGASPPTCSRSRASRAQMAPLAKNMLGSLTASRPQMSGLASKNLRNSDSGGGKYSTLPSASSCRMLGGIPRRSSCAASGPEPKLISSFGTTALFRRHRSCGHETKVQRESSGREAARPFHLRASTMGFSPPSQVIRLRETDDMWSAGGRSKGGAMDGAPDRVGSVARC